MWEAKKLDDSKTVDDMMFEDEIRKLCKPGTSDEDIQQIAKFAKRIDNECDDLHCKCKNHKKKSYVGVTVHHDFH